MKNDKAGWVYFIKCRPNYYKIGITMNSIMKCYNNYITHNPHQLSIMELIYVIDYKVFEEKILQKYFTNKTKKENKTDWCKLDQETVSKIISEMNDYQFTFGATPDYKNHIL